MLPAEHMGPAIEHERSFLARGIRGSTWKERRANERQSRDSNRNTTNAGPMRTNFCVSGEL